jgi:hypothetical protein
MLHDRLFITSFKIPKDSTFIPLTCRKIVTRTAKNYPFLLREYNIYHKEFSTNITSHSIISSAN